MEGCNGITTRRWRNKWGLLHHCNTTVADSCTNCSSWCSNDKFMTWCENSLHESTLGWAHSTCPAGSPHMNTATEPHGEEGGQDLGTEELGWGDDEDILSSAHDVYHRYRSSTTCGRLQGEERSWRVASCCHLIPSQEKNRQLTDAAALVKTQSIASICFLGSDNSCFLLLSKIWAMRGGKNHVYWLRFVWNIKMSI